MADMIESGQRAPLEEVVEQVKGADPGGHSAKNARRVGGSPTTGK